MWWISAEWEVNSFVRLHALVPVHRLSACSSTFVSLCVGVRCHDIFAQRATQATRMCTRRHVSANGLGF